MTSQAEKRAYIADLPVGEAPKAHAFAKDAAPVIALDVNKLPDGVITGSNLLQFTDSTSPQIRSAVALSLLAAQRVAANDPVIQSPNQWIQRHNTVLQNLGWLIQDGGLVDSKFDSVNIAVHKAIIPFLTAAFGGAAAAGALILTALQQLNDMDKDQPWITLFDQQSRHFRVTEYQFSVVEAVGTDTRLHLASARFDATYGITQVLFFKIKNQDAHFKSARSTLSVNSDSLTGMVPALQAKLADQTSTYIRGLKVS